MDDYPLDWVNPDKLLEKKSRVVNVGSTLPRTYVKRVNSQQSVVSDHSRRSQNYLKTDHSRQSQNNLKIPAGGRVNDDGSKEIGGDIFNTSRELKKKTGVDRHTSPMKYPPIDFTKVDTVLQDNLLKLGRLGTARSNQSEFQFDVLN